MRCACIDIGSNTTRVLVADVAEGAVDEVTCEKAFTRLGSVLRSSGALPEEALASVADVVAAQVAIGQALGAQRLRVVATAAIRAARNADALVAAVHARCGERVDVLEGGEEARLAFAGATFARTGSGDVAVVDVGGGSTEIAVGTPQRGVHWAVSLPIGSSSLTDSRQPLGRSAHEALAGLDPPPVKAAIAVGGSATSTARMVGTRIDAASARAALTALSEGEHDLEPERADLLPAGLALLTAASELLGQPLELGTGGLREGVCLELAGFTNAR